MKPEQVKKLSMGYYPTPLQRMTRLEKRLGAGPLYIKREDLSDIGLGGNKIRKLEYLVQDAVQQGCTALLTYGGPQTNHGRLTVAAAVRQGMKAILLLDGEKPAYYSGNLVLDGLMDADIRFIGDQNEEELTQKVVREYAERNEKVYVIPMGGSNTLGALGYIQMIPELMEQIAAEHLTTKALVCGAGSMGTFAGLWLGAAYYHAPFEVVGVTINPYTTYTPEGICQYINAISQEYEMGIECRPEQLHLERAYAGLGYNVPDEKTMDAIELLAQTEAIFLDPCYTGKVFNGYVNMIQNGTIPAKDAIFLHTGGVPGLWSTEHMDALQKRVGGQQ